MEKSSDNFLPDLCNVQSVIALVLVGELLAVALTVADAGLRHFDWLSFGLLSILVQWITLTSAACICPLRPWFEVKGGVVAGSVSYAIVLFLTLIYSVMGHWLIARHVSIDWAGVAGNIIIASIIAGVMLRYFYLQQQLRNQQQAELNARVQALQSRIRPHFLFNSMNSIASLIDIDPELAERMIVDLSGLFRASLSEASVVTLDEEINLCRQFVSIEQVRLGERLQMDWRLEHMQGDIKIPSLLLQPLLENAIYHGVQPLPKGGTVQVKVDTRGEAVFIQIVNPYQGKEAAFTEEKNNNGMALENIRHRLLAYYGSQGRLNIEQENGTFSVTIQYPANNTETDEG